MIRKHFTPAIAFLAGVLAIAFSSGASAQQQIQEDFTQGHITDSWVTYDGACLTAGDGTGNIPACVGLKYYNGQIQVGGSSGYLGQSSAPSSGNSQKPDPVGSGALRFTNSANNQAGGIISSGTPFPSGAGLQVTDRILLAVAGPADLVVAVEALRPWIAEQTLALDLEVVPAAAEPGGPGWQPAGLPDGRAFWLRVQRSG